jgi:hypothetical protein
MNELAVQEFEYTGDPRVRLRGFVVPVVWEVVPDCMFETVSAGSVTVQKMVEGFRSAIDGKVVEYRYRVRNSRYPHAGNRHEWRCRQPDLFDN